MIVGEEGTLVALPAGGHVLLEGGRLAETLTVKPVADVRDETLRRPQSTPDLVPAELVGTRIYRPDTGDFDSGSRAGASTDESSSGGATVATVADAGAGARRRRPRQRPGRACQ